MGQACMTMTKQICKKGYECPKSETSEREFVHIKQPVREGMLTFHQRKRKYSQLKQYMKCLQNHVVRGIVYNRFLGQKSKQSDQNCM